jgi:hypothetical protein
MHGADEVHVWYRVDTEWMTQFAEQLAISHRGEIPLQLTASVQRSVQRSVHGFWYFFQANNNYLKLSAGNYDNNNKFKKKIILSIQ